MKFPVVYALCACLTLSIGFGQRVGRTTPKPVKVSTRLQLQLEVAPPIAALGGKVFAKLKLKNVSEKPVSIEEASPEVDYDVTVVDAAGREPERTAWGRKKLAGGYAVLRSMAMRLQPGEERQVNVEITGVFNLTEPGTYYVKVEFRSIYQDDPEENHKIAEIAYSNTVELKIVSPDAAPLR
jgi:hypothetical protein